MGSYEAEMAHLGCGRVRRDTLLRNPNFGLQRFSVEILQRFSVEIETPGARDVEQRGGVWPIRTSALSQLAVSVSERVSTFSTFSSLENPDTETPPSRPVRFFSFPIRGQVFPLFPLSPYTLRSLEGSVNTPPTSGPTTGRAKMTWHSQSSNMYKTESEKTLS